MRCGCRGVLGASDFFGGRVVHSFLLGHWGACSCGGLLRLVIALQGLSLAGWAGRKVLGLAARWARLLTSL